MTPPKGAMKCPKCGARSGDDWSQCKGVCPLPASPHYKRKAKTMRATKWTPRDSRRATAEGWDLFTTSAGLEIQKRDESTVFEWDEQALDYVLKNARRFSHCRKAIKLVYGI